MTFAQRQELDRIGDRAAVAIRCEIEDHHYTVTETSVEVDGNELSLTVVVKFRQDEVHGLSYAEGWTNIAPTLKSAAIRCGVLNSDEYASIDEEA